MPISSTTRKAGPFVGNDVLTTFAFTFKAFCSADLYVVKLVVSTGVETVLTLTTDYTVDLNADQNTSPGGTITLTAPLPTGSTLVITTSLGNLQPTDLTNQGGFYPSVITDALDRAVILVQQLQEGSDRSIKYPISDDSVGVTLPAAAQRAGVTLAFDDDGAPIAGPSVADVGTVFGNIANINTVAGISADVTSVAANAANISTVAGISANVNTAAANIADINTVAADTTNIDTVAAGIANVNAVVANKTNIDTVAGISADVTTVAGVAAKVGTAADNVADITNFADVYLGPSATAPTTRKDSSALQAGDMYFDTATNVLHTYNGSTWVGTPTAHSSLTGLTTGDDHTQYHNDTRGDARYSLTSHTHESTYGKRIVEWFVIHPTTSLAVGDGKAYFVVPTELGGMNLVRVAATVLTAGTTNSTTIQIHNVTDAVDMLSTRMNIETGETSTRTSATPGTIDTTKDDVAAGDVLRCDIDAVSTAAPKGLIVEMVFQLP